MSGLLPSSDAVRVSVDLAVVSALRQEMRGIAQALRIPPAPKSAPLPYVSPRIDASDGRSVVLVVTGAGKTSAARALGLFLAHYRPTLICGVGIAGSALAGVEVGDVVVGTRADYYDVDATAVGIAYGAVTHRGPSSYELHRTERDSALLREIVREVSDGASTVHLAPIATGDTFVDRAALDTLPPRWRERIETCAAVDMESAAWAETSLLHAIPTTIVRLVSDHVHTGSRLPFPRSCGRLGEVAARWLLTGAEG